MVTKYVPDARVETVRVVLQVSGVPVNVLQSDVGAPPKFGAVNPALTAVENITLVLPKRGRPFGAVAVIVTVLPVVAPWSTEIDEAVEVVAYHSQLVRHAELSNVAARTVSASGVIEPFAIVTQVSGETLVWLQPVWNPTATPPLEVAAVMLKTAVKRRPAVGAAVRGAPGAAEAAT